MWGKKDGFIAEKDSLKRSNRALNGNHSARKQKIMTKRRKKSATRR